MVKPLLLMVAVALQSSSAVGAAPRYEGDFGLQWSCGGVGSDERRALAGLGDEAALELVMVTAPRGGYVAGAEVSLRGTTSTGAQLSGVADGPICLFKLPPGTYQIEALLDGTRRKASAVVKAGGKPARVVMSFPDKAWDGIRASDEEKRQARAP
jgi:hypothetical protein